MSLQLQAPQPLTALHLLNEFECGVAALNEWLKRRAIANQSNGEKGSDWPTERSYFALGLALEPAKEIGIQFGQDAIVWVGADAVPQLILLR